VLSQQDVAQGQPAKLGPALYRTTDGGATWSHVSDLTGVTGMALAGGMWGHTSGVGETTLEFADAQHGWLATGLEQAGSPSLLETTDGAKTWPAAPIPVYRQRSAARKPLPGKPTR